MSHALCDDFGHAAIEGFGDAAGEWALPGGFLDVKKDKTVVHTAARELKEEKSSPLGDRRGPTSEMDTLLRMRSISDKDNYIMAYSLLTSL